MFFYPALFLAIANLLHRLKACSFADMLNVRQPVIELGHRTRRGHISGKAGILPRPLICTPCTESLCLQLDSTFIFFGRFNDTEINMPL